MPRPRKETDDRRTETIAFRLTPAERLNVERAAAQAGMTTTDYVRTLTLSGRVVVRETRTLAPDLFDELRRIGVNLNQLARHANAGRSRPDEVARVCQMLETILVRELDASLPSRSAARAIPRPEGPHGP